MVTDTTTSTGPDRAPATKDPKVAGVLLAAGGGGGSAAARRRCCGTGGAR